MYEGVFICPDRTLEQRKDYRLLVAELKKRCEDEKTNINTSERLHLEEREIRKGDICNVLCFLTS